jgi:outer membrane protein assembly factor BamB
MGTSDRCAAFPSPSPPRDCSSGWSCPSGWLSPIPTVVGAAYIAAAALVAVGRIERWLRNRGRRGALLLAAGAAGVAAVLLWPGAAADRLNSRGIAWEAPEGESVVMAEAGLAVTTRDDADVLVGRDLETGRKRWSLPLGGGSGLSVPLRVLRLGAKLIVADTRGILRAIDARTGRQAWVAAEPAHLVLPVVASPEYVAVTTCDERMRCQAASRSIADGSVKWRAPVDAVGP